MQERDANRLYAFERYPLLVVISGTSGSGKDSVVKGVIAQMQERGTPAHFVVTATTRAKREGEVEGKDYFFVSRPEFEEMIARDELVEYAIVYGDYKGVPKQQVREAMASGRDVLMRLDIQGAAAIRRIAPEAVFIFITAPSEEELTNRLRQRETESHEQLQVRLKKAREEMLHIPEFDYIVTNPANKLDETIDTVMAIITAEKHRAHPRRVSL